MMAGILEVSARVDPQNATETLRFIDGLVEKILESV